MSTVRPLFSAALLATATCVAQSPDTLTFEVASVRVADSQPPSRPYPAAGQIAGGPGTQDPARMSFTWVLMRRLLMSAFDVPMDQISGPDWVIGQDARFDVVATVPMGATKEQANEMLLNLLKERFHLTYHRDKKEFDMYTLTVAKGGSKLKDAAPADGPLPPPPQIGQRMQPAPRDRDGFPQLPAGRQAAQGANNNGVSRMTFRMATPQMLLGMLQFQLGSSRSVDKTGLAGKYDFTLEFSTAGLPGLGGRGGLTANPADTTDPAPDLFSALEKQLGLKLEKSKTQLDVFVVDHMDRQPTEN